MTRTALFPGSFDPVTFGHLNLIERGLRLFDHVIVGVSVNLSNQPMSSFDERADFIQRALPAASLSIETLDGLLVHEAQRLGCSAILRGLRAVSDFDYELRMTTMNRNLAPDLETVFLMTEQDHFFISSSLIKEVARFGGDISTFVPPHVRDALVSRLAQS